MMPHKEIRQSFLDFFLSKGHILVSSSSLVPRQDPTILFTNSGMNQFKDIFLGLKTPGSLRVCDSQKCIRLSGKHNDLEEVGVDTYHHTFFEMLGNWSFGDFYKKEIIAWAWELLTERWGLPKNKLYATVYKDDMEAYGLWKSQTDIDPERIMFFGEKENFWEMAEVGPCGPCSEIHIDIGEDCCTCAPEKKEDCSHKAGSGVNQDCGRYIEIWNLVFIQYNREKDGSLTPLDKVYVDTGMGFERICAILQKKKSNYDTDIFTPIFDGISKLCNLKYSIVPFQQQIAFRVIADHIRAITFSITDGAIPSNEGRGYVIRRILRRAYRYGRELGLYSPFLHKLVSIVVKTFGNFFPELKKKEDFVTTSVLKEEEAFHKTLDKGLGLFERLIEQEKATHRLSGTEVFQLYDTYGFPFDLTKLMARERGYDVDEKGFEKEMQRQKKQSKKKEIDHDLVKAVSKAKEPTRYLGDIYYTGDTTITAILKNKKLVNKIKSGEEGILILSKTVFYGESGGQIGDIGRLVKVDSGKTIVAFEVSDTRKLEDTHLLYGQMLEGIFKTGDTCYQEVNRVRRESIRKNHTATHLLHQSLVDLLGNHIHQAGSLVSDEKLRFDFNHYEALPLDQLNKIEAEVNALIRQNMRLTIEEMKYTDAIAMGAKAFFEEKYEDQVRVVKIGNYSIELCGGSHVRASGEIGGFKIISESSAASGIRRIEAITGSALIEDYFSKSRILEKISQLLNIDRSELIPEKIKSLKQDIDQMKEYRQRIEEDNLKKVLQQSQRDIGGVGVYIKKFVGNSSFLSLLKRQVDNLRNHDYDCICFFAVQDDKKVTFLAAIGKGNVAQKVKAGNLVKGAASICGGGGGGRDDFAQAGGQNLDRVTEAMDWAMNVLSNKLS